MEGYVTTKVVVRHLQPQGLISADIETAISRGVRVQPSRSRKPPKLHADRFESRVEQRATYLRCATRHLATLRTASLATCPKFVRPTN